MDNIFIFSAVSTLPLGHIYIHVQCVPEALSLGIDRPGREVDHSPPSIADVKNLHSHIRVCGVEIT
jgi:hypothetical protein